MAVTLESLTLKSLQAQPLGYDDTDVVNGLVARSWAVSGLLRPAEWLELLNIFEGWQADRLQDPDTATSLSIGTTVAFSGSALGYSWTNVPCWFNDAPAGEAVGAYVAASFGLLDAEQSLQVFQRSLEQATENTDADLPDNGTISLGGATLTLLEQPDAYAIGPQLQRTAAGGLVINGPSGVVRSKTISGYTSESGWTQIKAWYELIAATTPVRGEYYPATAPSCAREVVVQGGIKTTRCVVRLELWEA